MTTSKPSWSGTRVLSSRSTWFPARDSAEPCWLAFQLEFQEQKKTLEQVVSVSLESSHPRNLPSRLICRVQPDGTLSGDARIFFPRTKFRPRPELNKALLVLENGPAMPLRLEQKPLGKAALRVDFASQADVPREALNADSKIRFVFDDQTRLDCSFLVTSE